MHYIELTENLVRLYVFLSQTLDRCLDQAKRDSFPDHDHHTLLAATRAKVMDALASNPVVKGKVEEECERILALASACPKDAPERALTLEQLKAERAVLQTKLVALSDLLAVFRAV